MTRHYERYQNEKGEYIKFGNQEIDIEKTHLNYNLAPPQNQLDFIKKRTAEVKCLNRKDVNVMCNWVVTAPESVQTDPGQEEKFFKETYKFSTDKYGEKNVVSAFVHKDETTPHMHFAFVPIVIDKKKNIEKVSAKELLTKKHLQQFHGELENHMKKAFGQEIGILNGATANGNLSITELKLKNAQERLSDLGQQAKKELGNIELLNNKEKALRGKIEALKGTVLNLRELYELKPEKSAFNTVKNVTVEDYKNLKKTAVDMTLKYNETIKECEILRRANMLYKSNEIGKDERIINAKNKIELERYKKAIEKLPKELQKEILNQNINRSKDKELEI